MPLEISFKTRFPYLQVIQPWAQILSGFIAWKQIRGHYPPFFAGNKTNLTIFLFQGDEFAMKRLPILDKLDEDLKESQRELQVDIPKAILTAREHGDLSENAEFKAAKERQMFLESRISLLQKRISDVMAINVNQIPKDRSGLGSSLKLKDLDSGELAEYHLVFPEEVNPDEGKISTASPVGRSLVGKQVGDELTISLPDSKTEYEVLKVITIHDDSEEGDSA